MRPPNSSHPQCQGWPAWRWQGPWGSSPLGVQGELADGPVSPRHPQILAPVLAREQNRTPWCLHPQTQLVSQTGFCTQGSTPGRPLPAQGSEFPSRLGHREPETQTGPGPGPFLPSSKLGPPQRTTGWVREDQDSSGALLAGSKAGSWGCTSWEDCRGYWAQSPASKLSPGLPRTQRGQSWPTPDGKCPDQGLSGDKRRGRDKPGLQRVAWLLHICGQIARGVCTWRWG